MDASSWCALIYVLVGVIIGVWVARDEAKQKSPITGEPIPFVFVGVLFLVLLICWPFLLIVLAVIGLGKLLSIGIDREY